MSKEAMKLALGALEWITQQRTGGMIQRKATEATTAIRQALEQPVQEPVAMRMPKVGDRVVCIDDESLGTVVYLTAGGSPEIKFDDGSHGTYMLREFAELFGYTTPPAQPAPVQEPVAWQVHPFDYGIGHQGVYARTDRPEQVEMWKRKGWNVQPLYTTPPAQEFVCSTGLCHYKPAAPVQPVASLKEADVLMIAEAHNIDPRTKGLYGFYIDCISSQPAAQPAPVHFAWMRYEEDCAGDPVLVLSRSTEEGAFRVYKEPAQRPWVGLTDMQVGKVIDDVHTSSQYGHHHTGFWMDFYRAIEAKLKELNT